MSTPSIQQTIKRIVRDWRMQFTELIISPTLTDHETGRPLDELVIREDVTPEQIEAYLYEVLTRQHEEDKAFYESVIDKVIGEDQKESYEHVEAWGDRYNVRDVSAVTNNKLKAEQRARAKQLMEDK